MDAMLGAQAFAPLAYAGPDQKNPGVPPATPIKHLIVLIGENRTFDHVFASYSAKNGQTVGNLLAKGIIDQNGAPGPNSAVATQNKVNTPFPSDSHYFISVSSAKRLKLKKGSSAVAVIKATEVIISTGDAE